MPDTEENIWGHFLLSSFWSHEELGCSLQKALMSLCQWVLLCFLVNFSLNKKLFHVIFERLNVLFWGHLVNFPRFNFTGSQVFLEFSEVFWMAFGWIYGWLFNFFPNKWSTGVSGLSVTVRPGKECRRWRLEGWLSIKLNWYSLWRHDQRDFWAELGLRSWRQGQLHWFSMCGQGWGPTGGASPGGSASTPPSSIEDVRMDLACTVLSYLTSFSPNLRASRPASRARYCFSSLAILVFRSSMVCSSYWMTVAWPSDFMSHTSCVSILRPVFFIRRFRWWPSSWDCLGKLPFNIIQWVCGVTNCSPGVKLILSVQRSKYPNAQQTWTLPALKDSFWQGKAYQ